MKKQTLALILLLLPFCLFAQAQKTEEMQKELSPFSNMIGTWEGSGWIIMEDRQKYTFDQTEKISWKLQNTAILIEGLGKSEGKTIHEALAILTFSPEKKGLNFRSYLSDGRSGDYKAEMIDNKLHWYPAENVRYIITIAGDSWIETGEYNNNGQWYKFFEMDLKRKS